MKLSDIRKLCDEALKTIQPEPHWKLMLQLLAIAEAAKRLLERYEEAFPLEHQDDIAPYDPRYRPIRALGLEETLKALEDE